jgi:outer membrane PBP1 activator LpoA protein
MVFVFERWIVRFAVLAAATLALNACRSLTENEGIPPSVDRAEIFARQGDQAGAARVYEELAAQNSGADHNAFIFDAARAYLLARRPDDAERVLALVEQPLAPQQSSELPLLDVQIALARGQGQQAWQRFITIPEPRTAPEAQRYLRLKQQAAFAAGRPADAVAAEIALERYLPTAQDLRQSRSNLLTALRDANDRGVRLDPRSTNDPVIRGWLELAPLAAAAARDPTGAAGQIEAWRARNPNHPANDLVRGELLGQVQQPVEAAAHIAVLLPITGRQSVAGVSVRDGFMTAYYQAPAAQRPRVRVYDTGEGSVAEAIQHAVQEGADLVVGPLTRDEVTAAADLAGQRPPILALNFLPNEHPAPNAFYQFALSPEDEARLAARRALEDGHRRGVTIVPDGDWGTRVLSAFKQELEAGGGAILASATVDTSQTDYSDSITQVLRISDSRARHRRLESILGTKLQFEPRRRGDIEYIFAPAQANIERLLRPQLRFHYAGDIATYATSDAFEPDPRANQDLEGLMFPDMPWMLGSDLADAVRAATREAWPTGGPRRGRLFAFGFDAYRLAVALRDKAMTRGVNIDGLTGRLSLDADGRVHRDLNWAQLHNGELKLLPEPAAVAAQ